MNENARILSAFENRLRAGFVVHSMQWQFLLTLNGHSMLQGCIFALTDWKI